MPVNTYCVIDSNDPDKIIENVIMLEDSEVSSFEQENGKTLVLSNFSAYSGIGNQYVNGYFQPVDPDEIPESWTKDNDGVWDAIKNMTGHPDEFWNSMDNEWVVLDPDSEEYENLVARIVEFEVNK